MKNKLLILINILIVVFEVIALFYSLDEFSYKLFTYYTQYSNLLALLSSTLLLIYLTKKKMPKWLKFLRYLTTNFLTITFLVVSFILVPMLMFVHGFKSFLMFTYGSMLYHHLLCPILFFISFVFLEKGCPNTKKDYVYSIIPTFAYGLIMAILNILQIVEGPYPFLMVEDQPIYLTIIWFIMIFSLAYIIGKTIFKLNIKYNKNI